jgi:DNA-binding transcriptional LysR family regulator
MNAPDPLQARISRLDIGTLRALDALLRERNVSKAAHKVGISQPTMSHLLARLRAIFDDALLVRGRTGFLLTDYAEVLLTHLKTLIPQLEDFGNAAPFAPETTRGSFRLACTEHAALVLLPFIQELVDQRAPHAPLKVLSVYSRYLNFEALEQSRFDLLLGVFSSLPADWHKKTLYEDRLVVMGGRALSDVGDTLSVAQFLAMKHVVLSADERTTQHPTDQTLSAMGLERRIVTYLSTFAAAPFIVARSDLIAVIPSVWAAQFAEVKGVRILPSPVEFPPFSISMAWHPRSHDDPAHRWFRTLIVEAAMRASAPR